MTLMTQMTGNTPETIGACLSFIYDRTLRVKHRISVVYSLDASLYAIGDDLEVLKARKKRWWEQGDPHQLKLPFSFYSPVKVLDLKRSSNRANYEIDIHFNGEVRQLIFYPCNWYKGRDNLTIRAIRVHRNVPTPRSDSSSPSEAECRVDRAVEAGRIGVIVTDRHDVYNRLNGEWVGYDLDIPANSRVMPVGSLTLSDGRRLNFLFNSVEWVHGPTPRRWGALSEDRCVERTSEGVRLNGRGSDGVQYSYTAQRAANPLSTYFE